MTTQYTKIQIDAGVAYVQTEFLDESKQNTFLHKLQVSDFVIGKDNKIIKARYTSKDIIETFLIVNSSPFLSKLVNLYNSVNKIITKA